MTDQKYKLSDRLRPGVECAAWVIDEVRKVEAERDALRARIEDAPSQVAKSGAWDVAPENAFLSAMLPQSYAGKRVALVVLGDDE